MSEPTSAADNKTRFAIDNYWKEADDAKRKRMDRNRFLIDRLSRNEKTLLIIDEAQTLSSAMLEEVRLLSNLETPSSKLLQIMLVGQPELNQVLARPELRQLRQRIVLRHQLRPFDEKDLGAYIDERLTLAGYTGKGIFKRSALKEIFDVTGGVPRVVNIVCDSALLAGYARGKTLLGSDVIREVARDLQLSGEVGEFSAATPEAERSIPRKKRRWLRRLGLR